MKNSGLFLFARQFSILASLRRSLFEYVSFYHIIKHTYQHIAAELLWFITAISVNSESILVLQCHAWTYWNHRHWGSENSVDLRVLYIRKLFLPLNVDTTTIPPQEVIEMFLTFRFRKIVTVLPPFSLAYSISQEPQGFYSPEWATSIYSWVREVLTH